MDHELRISALNLYYSNTYVKVKTYAKKKGIWLLTAKCISFERPQGC